MTGAPPSGAYLASHYHDARGPRDIWRVFHDDGLVQAFDGEEWWTVCTFTRDQVARAKDAIRRSGLPTATDIRRGEDDHDVAVLSYAWRLEGMEGVVVNDAYPARDHPVFEALDEQLDALEAEAGAEWSRL